MKKLIIGTIFSMLLIPISAAAGAYGTAGCGLGSMLFEPGGGFTQVFAATTNGTFANQTFGITSGTSNCTMGDATASLDQQAFVKINYASLVRDAARGNGEYLSAFATLLGCDATTHTDFFTYVQANSTLFDENIEPLKTLENVKVDMAKDAKFASSCTRL